MLSTVRKCRECGHRPGWVATKSELARCLGRHPKHIPELIAAGLPGGDCPRGGWNLGDVVKWLLERHTRQGKALTASEEALRKKGMIQLARQRKEAADKLARENAVAMGQLVRIEDLDEQLGAIAAVYRRRASDCMRLASVGGQDIASIFGQAADEIDRVVARYETVAETKRKTRRARPEKETTA